VTIVRPPGVYGPRDKEFFLYFKLVRRGIAPIPNVPESAAIDLIHARDLARGIRLAGESDRAAGGIYFLRGPGPHRIEDLARHIARAMGKTPLFIRVPVFLARVSAALADLGSTISRKPNIFSRDKLSEMLCTWVTSGERAREDLGFEAEYDLEKGLLETTQWYRENGWL
jgi:nucleoside-diphosphate-sugar epimerase